jgi:hypothetical protein
MINFENSKLHNEATRTMIDAAASAQRAFCAFEKIREDPGIVDSRVGGSRIPIGLRQKGVGIKGNLVFKFRKKCINLYMSYKLKFVKCFLIHQGIAASIITLRIEARKN